MLAKNFSCNCKKATQDCFRFR